MHLVFPSFFFYTEKTEKGGEQMGYFAVIDTETNWADQVMSIGTVIAERDTAQWYSYTSSTRGRYFGFYGPPEKWERLGCAGGYCLASLPMVEKVACYDR